MADDVRYSQTLGRRCKRWARGARTPQQPRVLAAGKSAAPPPTTRLRPLAHRWQRRSAARRNRARELGTSSCGRRGVAVRTAPTLKHGARVNIDGTPFDVPPADHMVVVSNDDRPGVIGTVGTILGDAAVNIADMDVARVEGSSTAVMLIAPTERVPDATLVALRAAPGILDVKTL